MKPSEVVRVVWRRKWRVLGVALVLAGIVYFHSDSEPDEYRAEVLLAVTPARAEAGASATYLARQYAALAETRGVASRAVTDATLRLGPAEARDAVDAHATSAGFVEVAATDRSPRRAEQLAAAVADALASTVRDRQGNDRDATLKPLQDEMAGIERQLSGRDLPADAALRPALVARYQELARAVADARVVPPDRVDVVSPARAASTPVSPTPARDALLTFLAGLVVFGLVTVAVEALSDRFSAEAIADEARRITGLPVLAEIPRSNGPDVLEGFRTLRTSLMFMSTSERLRTLAVVSVEPGSGKTFLALNLARETAALEVPVVLIDGDLRRPVIHDRLGIDRAPGLADALTSGRPLDSTGRVIEGWLRVVPAGREVADPAGLFGGRDFRSVLEGMTWAELVVVDTPAGGLFADALAIASQCDATILVIDAQSSRRRPVRRLVDNLRRVGAQPIGVVLNRTEATPRPSYYEGTTRRRAPRPPAPRGPDTEADGQGAVVSASPSPEGSPPPGAPGP